MPGCQTGDSVAATAVVGFGVYGRMACDLEAERGTSRCRFLYCNRTWRAYNQASWSKHAAAGAFVAGYQLRSAAHGLGHGGVDGIAKQLARTPGAWQGTSPG